MLKKEVLQIAKELMYIAGTYDIKTKPAEKEKLLKKITTYENKVKNSKTSYTSIVLGFIEDIKWDILAGREINIDNSKSDEYIESYFQTKNEVSLINNLILLKEYKEIFNILYSDKKNIKVIKNNIQKIVKNFTIKLDNINSKNIAKNLLIFTLFKRNKPSSALYRLSLILVNFEELNNEYNLIQDLTKQYNEKMSEIELFWREFLNKNIFNTNFLLYKTDNLWNVEIGDKYTDSSKSLYRTWNAIFEYKILLSNIKK